ncbi:hypothetical protein TSUD_385630 [Trifolium subterraneum]|uniref:Rx N-terminal domain-containing protein n=1 Tax=Trifolium subterraneum TaxID=3900 RepID=A0A2Z6MK17_TRISU|nr:hypothetical protein TSUD_385630 [Trifolium subterraneum]
MAMAAVGEAFLSAFIEVVLDRLASPDVVDLIRGKKVDVNLVQRLKNTLYAVEAVLNDAEQKQFKDSAVNKWLDDLKDAVYAADDILDHISTKAAISKNKKVSTVTNYFSRFFNSEERDMICKLENIVAKLEYIIKSKDILGLCCLQHIATDHHSSWRTPSTSLVDVGSNIFGRDQDKEAILKLLLDDGNDDDAKISVIPIVGMGGVGKTTLVQSVYNHDSVKQKFDVQAWACVSDHFDEFKVTKAIMEAVTRSACNINNKELLHLDLKEKLTGKKFLIVLDDVWTDDYDGALFPSLEYLEFMDLPCWEMWHHSHDPDNSFPVLKFLEINDCPKLKGDLPSHLPMLETIKIQGCNQLGSSLPKAFSIRELNIYQSNKVALDELPLSLEVLRIQGTEVIESVFEAIAITLPTSLQRLYIMDCLSPISFLGDCLPTSLKLLDIENCKNLNFPKQNQWHEPLQSLIIHKSCDSLSTLPLDNLPNLHDLQIYNCENIEHLSASKILSNLVSIKIRNCPKFVSFPREGLSAPNLESLLISKCSNLKSLPCHINTLLPKLQDAVIENCPEMETFPEGGMPPSLRTLYILSCEKLLRNPSLTSFDMISHLEIGDLRDDAIKSFPNKDYVGNINYS